MRVGIFTDQYYPLISGVVTSIKMLKDGLEQLGHQVYIFTSFDEKKAKLVIYSFKDGVLHSENNEPAVQYPGHWEIWEKGVLKKVVADGGDTEEYWENGVPVRIETNLAERRRKEAENGK